LHDVIHHTRPDGSPFPPAECAIDRAFPENHQQEGDEVFVHKDGSFYPVAFTASPIRDQAAKTVGTIVEVRDITKDRADEQARALLMREVDHRARNALMVVQSILQMTKETDIARFRDAVMGRVEALARAQGSLADRQWHGAPLLEVLAGALQSVASSQQYRLEGPDTMLRPEQVQPLSMIVHELATNARKYGALGTAGGRVRVVWRIERGVLSLVWQEMAGPPVVEPSKRGFGSRLMEDLAGQLGGTFSTEWKANGVLATLSLRV
jgi:two-component sensor histidine kinase